MRFEDGPAPSELKDKPDPDENLFEVELPDDEIATVEHEAEQELAAEPEAKAPEPEPEPEAKPKPKRAEDRIRKLVAQRHEVERRAAERIEAAEKRAAELEARLAQIEPVAYKASEGDYEGRLKEAKLRAKQLLDEGDTLGASEAFVEASVIATNLQRVREKSQQVETHWQQQRERPQAQPQAPEAPEAYHRWHARNTWFQRDPALTQAAIEVESEVRATGEYHPDEDEYYEAIDERLAARMSAQRPEQRRSPSPAPAPSPVAPVGRATSAPASGTSRKVTMSPRDVAEAARWGVSPETWARQARRGGVMD